MPTLQWSNRDEAVRSSARVPFRVLEHDAKLSCGDTPSDNMLIHGDNLEAAKALLPFFAGRVKCFAVDPPYNTRSAFEHYDDNVEHSTWLSLMYPRLELMRDLLAEDGSVWVCIDDNEAHYLKVMMDEVFGRRNFVGNVVWEKKFSPSNDAKWLSDNHDHIIGFAKNRATWRPLLLPRSVKQLKNFKNQDDDPRGVWLSADYTCAKSKEERPNLYYAIVNPNTGSEVWPKPTRVWAFDKAAHRNNEANNLVWWGKDGKNPVPRLKKFAETLRSGTVPTTVWRNDDVGNNQEARREILSFNPENPFSTPKPERLIQRILTIATNPGDLVCDLFLGSGTTAAVAHKMGRRWIGVEMGDHAVTHCAPRLRKVVDGEQGGISKAVNWQGGGGFGFYRLGPTITDEDGNINPAIRFKTLAAHVWFADTHTPYTGKGRDPLLGIHKGTAIYLLYNGILGDRSASGGNVLNASTFKLLPPHDGPKVVYGEWSQWGVDRLRREGITFKMIPYELEQV